VRDVRLTRAALLVLMPIRRHLVGAFDDLRVCLRVVLAKGAKQWFKFGKGRARSSKTRKPRPQSPVVRRDNSRGRGWRLRRKRGLLGQHVSLVAYGKCTCGLSGQQRGDVDLALANGVAATECDKIKHHG